MSFRRDKIIFSGIVQGVGFRPALARLAMRCGLGGEVRNCSGKVELTLTGNVAALERFRQLLPEALPGGAEVANLAVESEPLPECPPPEFRIAASCCDDAAELVVPPDLAVCSACRSESADPSDRRYRYPFNSCADCGPRYTMLESLPYDRNNISMRDFPLCPACRAEYADPSDRRFHVEGISCPVCGPVLTYRGQGGREEAGDPLALAAAALRQGKIVAFQSLGGFQLLADAANPMAVRELRRRKERPHQPLALMAADWKRAAAIGCFSRPARRLLESAAAPIVIVRRCDGVLPWAEIAPEVEYAGIMLPFTPLHDRLFAAGAPEYLVATSGNRRGCPLVSDPSAAIPELSALADGFLTHNRRIVRRNDDSVVTVVAGVPQVWRAARGLAPALRRWNLPLAAAAPSQVAAFGAELKNAVVLADRSRAICSPHIGDLSGRETTDYLLETFHSLSRLLKFRPESAAVDLHPDLVATRCGEEAAARLGLPVVRVQHHHAHAAAVLAEYGLEKGLALVMDGTGFGPDGTIWGAELLEVDLASFRRLATFVPVPLPGGDLAVLEPVRQLAARAFAAGWSDDAVAEVCHADPVRIGIWRRQCEQQVNAPRSRAAGRLFDAFAALLGVAPARISYEGQAAIRLESLAETAVSDGKFRLLPENPFEIRETDDLIELDWSPLFTEPRHFSGADRALAAAEFHRALALAAIRMIEAAGRAGERQVILTGGVLQNRCFAAALLSELAKRGRRGLLPRKLPVNDGGIAFGQAAVALSRKN